jgi:DNA-binding YbaB/EbfC family protein
MRASRTATARTGRPEAEAGRSSGSSQVFAGKEAAVFGQLGNIADLMRNAGKLRESVAKATEALGRLEVEGSSGGGAVTAKINGRMEMVALRIDPKLLADGDAELLEDLVVSAVNAAMAKARESAAQSLASAAGGLPPGLFPGGDAPAGPGGS